MHSIARFRDELGSFLICASVALSAAALEAKANLECTLDASKSNCKVEQPEVKACDSYREYQTSYNYLLDKHNPSFTKDQASRLAFAVARGCNGAAGRFIRVFDLLLNAKVMLPDATAIAKEMAQLEDENAETFVEVFKFAFLQSFLDLTLADSIKLARSISFDASGSSALAQKEFRKVVEFCLSKDGLGLPKADCAALAVQLLAFDAEAKTKSVGTAFISFFEFLRSEPDGPKLATFEALAVAKDVMKNHVNAAINFIPAYKFAADKSEMALNRSQAIDFAKKLAALTRKSTREASELHLKVDGGDQTSSLDVR